MSERFTRGETVQLREIPGIIGTVIQDLSGLTPPSAHVRWHGNLSGAGVVANALIERVVWRWQTQEYVRADSVAPDDDEPVDDDPPAIDQSPYAPDWAK